MNIGSSKRVLFTIIVTLILTNFQLFPILKGRGNFYQDTEVKWIYGENKRSRTIAFVEFENLSPLRKEIYDSYKTSLPRIIAEKIRNEKFIEPASNDFIPIKKVNGSYLVKEVTFTKAEENPVLMNEVFTLGTVQSIDLIDTQISNQGETNAATFVVTTNTITNQTSLGEVIKVEIKTNQIQPRTEDLDFFISLTNRQVAYHITNLEAKKYVFYIFKDKPQLYFDPQILEPYQKYFVSNDIFLPISKGNHPYYPLDKKPKKNFSLFPKLYRLNDAPIGNILNQDHIDYFVYGSFEVINNQMTLNIYVINTYEKMITHIYREKFPSVQIKKKSKQLDILILSFIQKKNIIIGNKFASLPRGAFLRINNRYIGTMPHTLDQWVAGEYQFEVWYPNQNLNWATSDNPITTESITLEKNNTQTKFFFETQKKSTLYVNINNNIPGNFYLNAKLMAKNKTSFSDKLYPGDYFVSVSRSDYVTRKFKISVEPNLSTSLSFSFKKQKPKSYWKEVFLDYGRNTKIFAAVGFGLGAASFGTYIHTLRMEDKKNSSQKRIEELSDAGLNTDSESSFFEQYNSDYNKYLAISLGLFSGSLISFIATLIFHSLDVYDKHAPIETSFNHKGDVEIKFIKDF